MPILLEVVAVQYRYNENMQLLSQSRDAAGPLEGVGTRDPTTHPICIPCLPSLSFTSLT